MTNSISNRTNRNSDEKEKTSYNSAGDTEATWLIGVTTYVKKSSNQPTSTETARVMYRKDSNQLECWHETRQIKVLQAGGKTAVWRTAIHAQIDEREAANWRQTKPHESTEPAGAGAENDAKTEMRLRTEGRAAKIRKTWRCQTMQAVKVQHPQTEIWRERNSRDSRVAQGDVLWTMQPRTWKIFRRLAWHAIVNKIFANR